MSKEKNYYENENLTLREWCDKLEGEGYDLKLTWDGGNDEGYVDFYIDDDQVDNKYTKALIEYCYDVLDYGSWAGDFSASGEAHYHADEGAFMGDDRYSTEETVNYPCRIEFVIPKDLWFDDLHINIDETYVKSKFSVKNGFLTEDHEKEAKKLDKYLEQEIEKVIDKFSNDYEYARVYEDFNLEKSSFSPTKSGDLEFTITSLPMAASEYDDKEVYVDVESADKYLNNED